MSLGCNKQTFQWQRLQIQVINKTHFCSLINFMIVNMRVSMIIGCFAVYIHKSMLIFYPCLSVTSSSRHTNPSWPSDVMWSHAVYPKKYAHGFVVLCFVVVMQSFIMNSHEVSIHIHQGCFAGTGAIVRLPQCQWSKPDGYGKISPCITTTKHS